jgi:endonuclease/exonuclease/phosphatase family metal-dependent hydrolase
MRVRVATLNVWALPTPFAQQVSARMREIGNLLPPLDLDIIAFQEVWTASARDDLIAGGRKAGLVHVWHTDTSLGGSGLMVLSRLPIEQARFERFALRGPPEQIAQGDYYGGKGFVQLRLKTPAGPVTLINTHLQARYSRSVAHEYRALRAGQVVQLAIQAMTIEDPIVSTGDFNFRDDDSGHQVLTGLTGLRDVAAELGHRESTVLRDNPYRSMNQKTSKRTDYVFARNGVRSIVTPLSVRRVFDQPITVGGRPAAFSNHAGVMAELEIAPTGTANARRPIDRMSVDLALRLLAEGMADARSRQRGGRTWVGAGVGCALVASAGTRKFSTTRRRLLRGALRGAAVAALAPAVGFSILSEVFVPSELRAFKNLANRLSQVDSQATDSLA